MADLSRTIDIIFNGVDSISGVMRNIGGGIDNFGNSLTDFGKPFADVATKVAELNLAIVGIGAVVLKARSDIESETTKMANALGSPIEEIEEFAGLAKKVYKDDFAETIEEAFGLTTEAATRFKNSSIEDLNSIIENSQRLAKTFDVDYAEVMSGVQSLMGDFGISANDAFDFMASGFQEGLNKSGDFIESIGEYGGLFADAKATPKEFFETILTGYDQSILGTDKVADAFKEFGIKIREGSEPAVAALANIGIDYDTLSTDLESGKTTIFQAFSDITKKIGEVKNENEQFKTGVELLGVPFEDLGIKAVKELGKIGTGFTDLSGTMAEIDPDESLGKKFTQLRKTITTELTESDMWDGIERELKTSFGGMKSSFEEAFGNVDFSDLETAMDSMLKTIGAHFSDMDLDITTVEGMSNAIDLIKGSVSGVIIAGTGLYDALSPIVTFAKDASEWFSKLNPETQEMIGYMTGVGTALGILGGVVSVGGALVTGLGAVVGQISALRTLGAGGAILITFGVGWTIGGILRDTLNLDEPIQKAIRAIDKVINFTGTMGEVDLGEFKNSKEIEIEAKTGEAEKQLGDFFAEVDQQEVEINADMKTNEAVDDFFGDLDSYEAGLDVEIDASLNTESSDTVKRDLEQIGTVGGEPIYFDVTARGKDFDEVKQEISEIPAEKLLEVKAKLEEATIDATASMFSDVLTTLNTEIEWSTKLDIAKVEAEAEVAIAAFDSVAWSIESTSSAAASMFSDLAGMEDFHWSDPLFGILEGQMELQSGLIEAQIKLIEAQVKRMESGDPLVTVSGEGLQPHLEGFMFEILNGIQVRMNETMGDYLIGTGA